MIFQSVSCGKYKNMVEWTKNGMNGEIRMRIFLLAALVFGLDRLTKALVAAQMAAGQSIPVIPGFFHFTFILNPGAAFGIFRNQTAFFVIVTLAVIITILYFVYKLPTCNKFLCWGFGLELGGALGNLVDRLLYGKVIDFFDFQVWPVFNIADIAIVAGVGALLIGIWRIENESKNESN